MTSFTENKVQDSIGAFGEYLLRIYDTKCKSNLSNENKNTRVVFELAQPSSEHGAIGTWKDGDGAIRSVGCGC